MKTDTHWSEPGAYLDPHDRWAKAACGALVRTDQLCGNPTCAVCAEKAAKFDADILRMFGHDEDWVTP